MLANLITPEEAASPSTPVLIVGASARAAVHSLARAGLDGVAVDLFGDRDLTRHARARVCPLHEYPDAFPVLAAEFPPGPFIYTGGLENHPHVVAQLAGSRPLWGNPPAVLARVRDPHALQAFDQDCVRIPRLVPHGEPAPTMGQWLRKPLRSSAGHGIRFAIAGEEASATHCFQEFALGPSFSALFASAGMPFENDRHTRLLGITEQLIGEQWLHTRPFAYCGNIGPVSLPPHLESDLHRFGCSVASATGLLGLWGLDFIVKDVTIYPLEVNPRYTAGTEVLELGSHLCSMTLHAACFTHARVPEVARHPPHERVIGKAIYYAPSRIIFPASGPWDADLAAAFEPWRVPSFADIPEPGAAIDRGLPVLTFLVTGPSAQDCCRALQSRVLELDLLFSHKLP